MERVEQKQNKPSRFEQMPGYGEVRERLKTVPSLRQVWKQAERYATDIFPFYGGTVVGLDLQHIQLDGVLKRGDYQQVSPKSEEYGQLMEAKSLQQRVAREMVREVILDNKSAVKLPKEQQILLNYGMQIQDVVDGLHLVWQKELVRDANAPQMKALTGNTDFMQMLVGDHGDYLYGMLRKEGEAVRFVRYSEAYKQQIGQIAGFIDNMVGELVPLAQAGNEEAKANIAVHTQLKKLLLSQGNAKEQEEIGKELDVIWMRDASAFNPQIRSQIVYPMETYAGGKSVEWQYDILLKDPEFDGINEMGHDTKARMLDVFQNDPDFRDLPALQNSLSIFIPTNSTVYLRFISGTPLGFRSAASKVPNRAEVTLGHDIPDSPYVNGAKINFDYITLEQRAEIGNILWENLFKEHHDGKEDIPPLLGRFVSGHEDAHNLMEREDLLRVVGAQNHIDLDEVKADLASSLVCFDPKWLPISKQSQLMRAVFAEELRGLSRWREMDLDRAHLNGNLILIQSMMDLGILDFTNGKWHLDTEDPQKLAGYHTSTKNAFLEFAKIYEATDPEVSKAETAAFKAKYLDIPSRKMLQLVRDSGILSENEYRAEMQKYYPTDGRRTEPNAA